MTDTTSRPELPRFSRSIARTAETAWPRQPRTLPVPGRLPPFVSLLRERLPLRTVGVDLPTLSYLVWGSGDAATRDPRPRTTPGPRADPTPDAPARRHSPQSEAGTTLRTVVRELVHVREPPTTVGERRAGVGRGPRATTGAPGVDHLSGLADVSGVREAGDTTPATVEWSVVRRGRWTGVIDESSAGARTTDTSPSSTRSVALRGAPAPLSLRRETETTTTTATASRGVLRDLPTAVASRETDDGRTADPTGAGSGRRSRVQPRLTVAADTGTRSVGEPSRSAGRSRESDAFGPPAELTVRRAGGANGGTGDGPGGAGGATTRSVDLADLGGTSGRTGRPGPSASTPNGETPPTRQPLDLSRAPRAEVDRLVDRLYGELTRRHRIERERRGR